MAEENRIPESGAEPSSPGEEALSHLERAEDALRQQERSWAERVRSLEAQLESVRATNRDLGRHLETLQRALDEERGRAERQRERAERLDRKVRDLHRRIFGEDLYRPILEACLSLSDATRGLYVAWRDRAEAPEVRAAIGIGGYPEAPPSDFLTTLCRRVLDSHDTLVYNRASDRPGLPEPERRAERFDNFAAAPVMLQKNLDGVLLVADRAGGDFHQHDLEMILGVGDHATIAVENQRLHRDLQDAYFSTIAMLSDAVEAKDPYTHGHCEMASVHARLTAQRMGLSERDQSVICYAALLHDVGKIGVSDGVLNKPGPLLPEEREIVRAHVRVGYDLIRTIPVLQEVAEAVLYHHEWYDGSGYPAGLRGEEIPIASRIVGVVDAYGAMITRRSYKEAYPEEHARGELRRAAGIQFDPAVVEAFLSILDAPAGHVSGEAPSILACGLVPVASTAPDPPRQSGS